VFVFYGNPAEAAWILRAVGFVPACLALYMMAKPDTRLQIRLLAGLFTAVWFLAFPIGGEVYITLSISLALLVFLVASRSLNRWVIAAGVGLAILCGIALSLNDSLLYRFTEQTLQRLPWKETSDYYPAWVGGLRTGMMEPVLGVGPEQYWVRCMALSDAAKIALLGTSDCSWHPHNTFIQLFAETGLLGVMVFITSLLSMTVTSIKVLRSQTGLERAVASAAFATFFLFLWPVSSYSAAFGQQMNGLTWFALGVALAGVSISRAEISFWGGPSR
jgi:O-antigen ligase